MDTVDFLIKQIGASLPGVHSKAASVSSIMRELEVEGNMRGTCADCFEDNSAEQAYQIGYCRMSPNK